MRWRVPLRALSLLEPGMGLWRSGLLQREPLQRGPLQRAPPWLTKEPWMELLLLVPWMGLLLFVPGMERPEGPGPKGTSS